MHEGDLTLFLVGVAVIGLAPVVMLVVYFARRRADAKRGTDGRRDGRASAGVLRSLSVGVVGVAALALGIAWYLGSFGRAAAPADPAAMEGMGGSSMAAPSFLPRTLAGLAMTSGVSGPDAVQEVFRLHGSEFPITGAEVARYGGGSATVWVSWSTDPAASTAMVERMTEKIAGGDSPFAPPEPLRGATDVWVTHGMGQVHYFYARGNAVWWISADRKIARQALDGLLGEAA